MLSPTRKFPSSTLIADCVLLDPSHNVPQIVKSLLTRELSTSVSRLLTVDLSDNAIEEWEVDETWSTTIGSLVANVDYCDLRRNRLGVQGWCGIFAALAAPDSLSNTRWDLDNERIKPEIAKGLSEILRSSPALTMLDLHDNPSIQPEGIAFLATGLAASASLVALNLNGCALGADGVDKLTTGFGGNNSLQTLLLMHNRLGSEGATALATVLTLSKSLAAVDVGFNELGVQGARALVDAVRACATLQKLGITGNNLQKEGIVLLAASMYGNGSLEECDARWNNLPSSDKAGVLSEAAKVRPSFKWLL